MVSIHFHLRQKVQNKLRLYQDGKLSHHVESLSIALKRLLHAFEMLMSLVLLVSLVVFWVWGCAPETESKIIANPM